LSTTFLKYFLFLSAYYLYHNIRFFSSGQFDFPFRFIHIMKEMANACPQIGFFPV